MTAFGERLRIAVGDRSRLCVGIDPHESLLTQWGLETSAAGVREFGLRVVDAAADRVAVIKPQVGFFERFGSAGFAALEDVLAAARAAGLIVIGDAKRGDIGSTMDGYAAAWLTPGAPLEVDALTVSPYLGVGALDGAIRVAIDNDKGLFVLAATSNPEASDLQRANALEETVAGLVEQEVSAHNLAETGPDAWGSIGLVIGATVNLTRAGIGFDIRPPAPILAPGFGAQGARLGDIDDIFGALAPHVLASVSRSVLSEGPDGLAGAIDAHISELEGQRG